MLTSNLSDTVIICKEFILANIRYILVTFTVLKFARLSAVIPLHPSNIESIVVTADVSKFDRSILLRLLHPENILLIVVTFEVLKLPVFNVLKLLHPLNILLISVTLKVLKLERFREVMLLHAQNIPDIVVTCDVSNCGRPAILVSLLQRKNIFVISVTRLVVNEVKSNAVTARHSANIVFIVVTFDVPNPEFAPNTMLSKA